MKSTSKLIIMFIAFSVMYFSSVDVHAVPNKTYFGEPSIETIYLDIESESGTYQGGEVTLASTISSSDLKITRVVTPVYNSITHYLMYFRVEITWEWLVTILNFQVDTLVVTWDNSTVEWRMMEGSFVRKHYVKQPINPNTFVLLSTNYSMSDVYNNGFSYDQQLTQYPSPTYNKGYMKFNLEPIEDPNVQYKALRFYVKYYHKIFVWFGPNGAVRLDGVDLLGIPTITFESGINSDFDSAAVPFVYNYAVTDPNY